MPTRLLFSEYRNIGVTKESFVMPQEPKSCIIRSAMQEYRAGQYLRG